MKRRGVDSKGEKTAVSDGRAVRVVPGINVHKRRLNTLLKLAKSGQPDGDILRDLRTDREKERFPSYYFHPSFAARGAKDRYALEAVGENPSAVLEQETTRAYAQAMHYAAYRVFIGSHQQEMWREHQRMICDAIIRGNQRLVFSRLLNILHAFDDPGAEDELEEEGIYRMLPVTQCYNPWSEVQYSTYACNSLNRVFTGMMRKRANDPNRPFDILAGPDGSEIPEEETIPSKNGDPSVLTENAIDLAYVYERAAAILTPEEFTVLQRRFGWKEAERKDIGLLLGCSRERIRNFEVDGIDKLRLDILGIPIPWRQWHNTRKKPPRMTSTAS